MTLPTRILPLALVFGVLVGCDGPPSSPLAPRSPSFSTTGEAIATRTDAMQVRIDELHASEQLTNAGIVRGLKKLLANAGEAALRDDLHATENMMVAFQNRVRAQRGKHIQHDAADELHAAAQEVIDLANGTTTPAQADLSLSLTMESDPLADGQHTFTVLLSNAGPDDVTDVQVTLLVLVDGEAESVSYPAECTLTAASDGMSLTYDCTVASLAAGADETLTAVVQPSTEETTLDGQADITDFSGAEDPNPDDNIAAGNRLPAVQISGPPHASAFIQGEEITFSGSATDPEDGAVTGTSLVWASSIDGQIGTGGSFARSDLSTGTHTITLTATDNHGASGSASVTMDVVALGTSQGSSLQWTKVLGAVTDHAITLYDAWGTSSTDVWAVGSGDGSRTAILRYDGANWTKQPTGTTAGFLGVWGSSSNDVFFVGSHGTIRHFDGANWSFHDTPHTKNLRDVWGASGTDVWAVGAHTILHYDGSTWTEELTDYRLTSIWGSSNSNVWAVGPGAVLRYDGQAWEPQSYTFPSGHTLTSGGAPLAVWGSGSQVFIAGQYGKLLHYDASTATWTQHKKPSEISTEAFYSLWGTSPTDVYAVGSFGTVLHFDGTGWSRIRAGGPTLWGIWGSASGGVFTVGGGATILHHTGSDWNVHSTGVTFQAIWGASATDVFAVGHGGLILHYDGASWSAQDTGLTGHRLAATAFRGVSGTSGSDVWVVGDGGAILHYDGVSWTESASGTTATLVSVWGNSSDNVFAVGSGSTILHYDGASWTGQTSPVTSAFHDVFGASGDAVWAVGSGGAIVYYDGTSWSAQTSGTADQLYGVWAAASNRAFATGNVLGVLHYDGTSWTEHSTGTYSGRDVWGASLTDVFTSSNATSALGKILHYDGSTWSAQDTGVGNVLFHGIWGSSATDVYAVGWEGTIVRGTP